MKALTIRRLAGGLGELVDENQLKEEEAAKAKAVADPMALLHAAAGAKTAKDRDRVDTIEKLKKSGVRQLAMFRNAGINARVPTQDTFEGTLTGGKASSPRAQVQDPPGGARS